MCNLNGLIREMPEEEVRDEQNLRDFALMNAATSISFASNRDSEGVYLNGKDVLARSEDKIPFSDKRILKALNVSTVMLAHERIATSGKNFENCQPFANERFVLAHNGILTVKASVTGKSDTAQLFEALVAGYDDSKCPDNDDKVHYFQKKMSDALHEVCTGGSMSILVYDKTTKVTYYFKSYSTDIEIAEFSGLDKKKRFFVSTGKFARGLVGKDFTPYRIDEGVLYTFTKGKEGIKLSQWGKINIPTFQYLHTKEATKSNDHFRGTSKQSSGSDASKNSGLDRGGTGNDGLLNFIVNPALYKDDSEEFAKELNQHIDFVLSFANNFRNSQAELAGIRIRGSPDPQALYDLMGDETAKRVQGKIEQVVGLSYLSAICYDYASKDQEVVDRIDMLSKEYARWVIDNKKLSDGQIRRMRKLLRRGIRLTLEDKEKAKQNWQDKTYKNALDLLSRAEAELSDKELADDLLADQQGGILSAKDAAKAILASQSGQTKLSEQPGVVKSEKADISVIPSGKGKTEGTGAAS